MQRELQTIYKAKKEMLYVNFLKILYNFEALKFHLLFQFYCFSPEIYHQPFRNLWTIRWKVMDTKHFICVFRASKLYKHKQVKILLKSSLEQWLCLKTSENSDLEQ